MNSETVKHHPLGMSRWPAWDRNGQGCPCFDGKPASADATAGTRAHAYLAWLLTIEEGEPQIKPPEADYAQIDAAEWAASAIKAMPGSEAVCVEQQVKIEHVSFALDGIFGTPDAYWWNGVDLHVADFKLFGDGSKCYTAQLAGYALAIGYLPMRPNGVIYLHTLNGLSRTVESMRVTLRDCHAIAHNIIKGRLDMDRQPRACDWCGLCAHAARCPALLRMAATVSGLENVDAGVVLSGMEITIEQKGGGLAHLTLAGLLTIAKTIKKWVESVEDDAKRAAETLLDGTIEGNGVRYELKPRRGQRKIDDICELAGAVKKDLSSGELIALCGVSFSTVVDALRRKGYSKKDAEAMIEPYFPRGEGGYSLERVG